MSHLLDTNACIAVINDRPSSVRIRLREAIAADAKVAVPTIALFELWFGVAKSAPTRRPGNEERLTQFLAGPVEVLPFMANDARMAGRVRETLRAAGTPIGPYDVLIAGQALSRGLTLVTGNTGEFARVDGLACVDWCAG